MWKYQAGNKWCGGKGDKASCTEYSWKCVATTAFVSVWCRRRLGWKEMGRCVWKQYQCPREHLPASLTMRTTMLHYRPLNTLHQPHLRRLSLLSTVSLSTPTKYFSCDFLAAAPVTFLRFLWVILSYMMKSEGGGEGDVGERRWKVKKTKITWTKNGSVAEDKRWKKQEAGLERQHVGRGEEETIFFLLYIHWKEKSQYSADL